MMRCGVIVMIAITMQSPLSWGQKIDEEKMTRDIEVAENVLATLIKHEISQERIFGMEVHGTYQEGYGVTFRVPGDYSMPFLIGATSFGGTFTTERPPVVVYSDDGSHERKAAVEARQAEVYRLKANELTERKRASADSAREEYNKRVITAAKNFILDYGDFISQLGPNEKIIVTNQRERRSYYFADNKRTHLMVEGTKADITAFRQGKISRDQALNKLKVVNTETVEVRETDMELLSSIFSRLYRPDLSTTYFTEDNMYYERLKDYGVIFYMQLYSSTGDDIKVMPTQGHAEMDEATRNKKVTELYPKFERELKENILEYGRTVKSLQDNETMVFNVTLTKCVGCGIPSTLELGIRQSTLKEYSAGKIDKNAAIAQFTVKKGPNQ